MTRNKESFGKLARSAELSPETATVLTVIARLRRQGGVEVQNLVNELSGDARQAALLLLGEHVEGPSESATQLADYLQEWGEAAADTGSTAQR